MKTSPTRTQLIKSGIIRPTPATAQKPRDNQAALAARRASFHVAPPRL
jgi:hypothetical protein